MSYDASATIVSKVWNYAHVLFEGCVEQALTNTENI